MSANEQLASEGTTHSSVVDVPPDRDGRHHRHRHHHRRSRLHQKLKIGVLIGIGMVVALVAWYLVVTYLDERTLGATLRRTGEMLGVTS